MFRSLNFIIFYSPLDEEIISADYWSAPHPQLAHLPQLPHPLVHPKVQVMPVHPSSPDMSSSPPPTPPEEEDREKFKCLYLLVETAVAVRQREKEQSGIPI